MPGYAYSDDARRDLDEIGRRIARDNPVAARRWLAKIRTKLRMIVRQPLIGEACDDIRPGMRFVILGSYVVYYSIRNGRVFIVRVVHGARDVGSLFSQS